MSLSLLAALSLVPACGDSGVGDGNEESATGDETATSNGDGDTMEAGTNDQGDGDGDPGDGDGDPGDGDGDTGDGDGDTGDGDGDTGDGDGDTGDGDGDTGDGDGDGDGDMACQEFAGEVAPIPPSVMFLLDRSGSMMEQGFDVDDPGKTRWQALYEAVEAVVSNGSDATIAFGAKTFSTQGQGACGVSNTPDVPIAIDNSNVLLSTIPGPMEVVNGGTPTNLAIEKTMSIMEFFDAGDSDKFIFLITDGRIQCVGEDPNNPTEEEEAQALADAVAVLDDGFTNLDVTTYVVGIAPSMFGPIETQLEEMAIAGGAPKDGIESFYRADDADQLSEALAAVVEDSYGKSCLLDLEEEPFFPDYTKVVVGDVSYDLVDDCDSEDGFIYSMEYSQLELCGAACDDLAIEQNAEVQFYCNPG
ncbi:von Willebrand factor type A domain protein [Enhygromyxa salina]|uniref:von Willebrand factor type A domain protein n=1 Tax=Enhygromyxa salina TaxID=215803 RepID=A0A2S9YL42_9BACT|nr:von Willebrand factor type A domain protein [Enhygromyxa salina]